MKNYTTNIARIVLGITFVFAGIAKTTDFSNFVVQLAGIINSFTPFQTVFAAAPLAGLAAFVIASEIAVGLLLITGKWQDRIIPISALVVFSFLVVNFRGLLTNPDGNCGCFGSVVQTSYIEIMILDFVLLLVSLVLLKNHQTIKSTISL